MKIAGLTIYLQEGTLKAGWDQAGGATRAEDMSLNSDARDRKRVIRATTGLLTRAEAAALDAATALDQIVTVDATAYLNDPPGPFQAMVQLGEGDEVTAGEGCLWTFPLTIQAV